MGASPKVVAEAHGKRLCRRRYASLCMRRLYRGHRPGVRSERGQKGVAARSQGGGRVVDTCAPAGVILCCKRSYQMPEGEN